MAPVLAKPVVNSGTKSWNITEEFTKAAEGRCLRFLLLLFFLCHSFSHNNTQMEQSGEMILLELYFNLYLLHYPE